MINFVFLNQDAEKEYKRASEVDGFEICYNSPFSNLDVEKVYTCAA